MDSPENNSQNGATRMAGMILIAASLVALPGIVHHPAPADHSHRVEDHPGEDHRREGGWREGGWREGDSIAKFVDGRLSRRFENKLVHGTMLVVVGLFVLATSYVASSLGFERICVRAGMVAYGFGALSMAGAASVDGFVFFGWSERLLDTGVQELAVVEAMGAILWEINRVTALLGVLGMSLGVLLWSLAMLEQKHPWRVPGGLGVCVGLVGVIGVLSGHLEATVLGMIWFVSMQVVWNIFTGLKTIKASRAVG
jgi:hypothetical protein